MSGGESWVVGGRQCRDGSKCRSDFDLDLIWAEGGWWLVAGGGEMD